MADLKITELQALAGANLAAADELAVADISASETKKITVSDLIAFGADLISNAEIPSAKISFAAGSIVEASLAAGAVTAAKIGSDAVTATKLADQSTCIVAANLAALQAVTGDFVGQLGFTTDNAKIYLWQNSTWNAAKAAGSINTISADTSGIVNITVSTSGDTATVGTSLDNTGAAGQFLAGPTGSAGAVGYRAVVGTDLPVPTTTTKGAIAVNGEGLRMDGDRLEINNDVTLSATHHLVTYDAKGLINGGRTIISADLPAATSGAIGAVTPGTGLSVNGAGALNHTNVVTPGTYAKITFDAQGHVSAGTALADTDLPNHSAALLTSGTLNADRIASNAITAAKLADYATTTIGNAPPAAEHIGQFFFNPLERTLFLWDGNVYQPVGISAGEIVFSGTYDASVNQVDSVTTDGAAIGLVAGQALPAAGASNRSYYVVVSQTGTGTTPAPAVTLEPPDILLSNGTSWVLLEVSETVTAQLASNVQFSPTGDIVSTNVQSAIAEVDSEKLPKAGGTMTGNLELGQNVALVFEGSTADGNETTLTVANPTADRTITLPNVSGTVVTTGDTGTVTSTMIADATIVDADISASAEIAVSKLADGTPRQLLQTDAAGTGVEWASNIDIPGTLDVTSAATFDSSVAVTGALTKSGNNVVTVGDTGTVTSSMIADGTIVNADINASAAIAGTKISPDFGSQTITTTGIVSNALGTAAAPSITFTGDLNTGIYSPGADQVAISTNGVARLRITNNNLFVGPANAETCGLQVGDGATGDREALIDLIGDTTYTDYGTRLTRSPGANGITYLAHRGTGAISLLAQEAAPIIFNTSNTERLRIDSSGRLLVGTSSASTALGSLTAKLQVEGTNVFDTGITNTLWESSTNPSQLQLVKSRGASIGTHTVVQNNDNLGRILFGGSDGTNFEAAAWIQAQVDGTPGTDDMPGRLVFSTTADGANSPTERVRIDSSGRVGIGTTDPVEKLEVRDGNIGLDSAGTSVGDRTTERFYKRTDNGSTNGMAAIGMNGAGTNGFLGEIKFYTGASDVFNTSLSERARIDSSGRLLVGTSSAIAQSANVGFGRVQVLGNGSNQIFNGRFTADAAASVFAFIKSRNDTVGSHTIVNSGDNIGQVNFQASDGSDFINAALIKAEVDGTPGANDMPGRLVFSTTADGASSPTERLRITSAGNMLFGGTASPASATKAFAIFNGTAPTGSVADGVVLYAEDVSSSSELKVRDEAGNVTTLSPHNFDLIPDGPSEDMAWSYYSERDGKRINVDMLKAIRLLEQISGEKLVYSS